MYKAYVTKIADVRKHTNADRLLVGKCFGNNVIVGLGVQSEDVGIYFPSDGQLDYNFALANNLVRLKDESGKNTGGYLDPVKLNIRAIKLRGEKSDGLFIPIENVKGINTANLEVGYSFSEVDGTIICKKYVPEIKTANRKHNHSAIKNNVCPLFKQHINTPQLMYNLNDFEVGDICYISLKLHGTSQRTGYLPVNEVDKGIFNKIRKLINKPLKYNSSHEYITGSRRVVLGDMSNESNDFYRKSAHNQFVDKLHKGETVYYEIVGYSDTGASIMGVCNNSKIQDKDFIKQYGKTTTFAYGCKQGESKIYIYRMTMTNEDGYVVEYPDDLIKMRADQMGIQVAPELDRFIYTTQEDLLDRVNKYVDGADLIDPSHIREGIVVRREGKEVFAPLKYKSFDFKVLEGIIKDSGIADEEEIESLQ